MDSLQDFSYTKCEIWKTEIKAFLFFCQIYDPCNDCQIFLKKGFLVLIFFIEETSFIYIFDYILIFFIQDVPKIRLEMKPPNIIVSFFQYQNQGTVR